MLDWAFLAIWFAWYMSGWLPSRILKHYFLAEFPDQGDGAFGLGGEALSYGLALGGPICLASTLLVRWTFGQGTHKVAWGWRW